MRFKLAVQAALLLFSTGGMAATVEYQHPQVTIVAVDETLESVLTALGKEMKLTVTTPVGINPVVNCDIQNQPINRAFKNLLGDLSYSLVWADDGERLTGLVILEGDGESADVAVSAWQSSGAGNTQVASVSGVSGSRPGAVMPDNHSDADPKMVEHRARLIEERELQKARMMQRREEDEIAHKAKMSEERTRRKAEHAAYIESLSYRLPQ